MGDSKKSTGGGMSSRIRCNQCKSESFNDNKTVLYCKRCYEELEEKLKDITDTYKEVMNEKCSADEMHCTCVPFLRDEIKQLRKIIFGMF
jgi:hypothetical protein